MKGLKYIAMHVANSSRGYPIKQLVGQNNFTLNTTIVPVQHLDTGVEVRTYVDLNWPGSPVLLFNIDLSTLTNFYPRDVGSAGFDFSEEDSFEQSLSTASQAKVKNQASTQSATDKVGKLSAIRESETYADAAAKVELGRTKFKTNDGAYAPLKKASKSNYLKYGESYNRDAHGAIERNQLKHNEAHLKLATILDLEGVALLPLALEEGHYAFLSAQDCKDKINEKKQAILPGNNNEFDILVDYEKKKLKFLTDRIKFNEDALNELTQSHDKDLDKKYIKSELKEYFTKNNSAQDFNFNDEDNITIFFNKIKTELQTNITSDKEVLQKKKDKIKISENSEPDNTNKIKVYVENQLSIKTELFCYAPKSHFPDSTSKFTDVNETQEGAYFEAAKAYFQSNKSLNNKHVTNLLIKQYPIQKLGNVFNKEIDELFQELNSDNFAEVLLSGQKNPEYIQILQRFPKAVLDLSINNIDKNGCTPLHIAAENGHLEFAKLLIERGANKDKENKDGFTPLHLAAQNGHLDIAKFLIESGADKDKENNDGLTPLHIAVRNGHLDIAKFLIEQGADKDKGDRNGWTPLHIAAENGHLEIAKFLIESGADKDKENKNGFTPLHIAARNGHLDIAKFLIEQGADKDKANNDGLTPLYLAARKGHLEVAKFLIEQGADKDKANNYGFTPLHLASIGGHLEVARFLIEKGADKDKANNDGFTPLYIAAHNGRLDIAKFLIEQGADKDKGDRNGHTPLHIAAHNGHLDIAKFLIESGADKDKENKNGFTPLHLAAQTNNSKIVKELCEMGAEMGAEIIKSSGILRMLRATRYTSTLIKPYIKLDKIITSNDPPKRSKVLQEIRTSESPDKADVKLALNNIIDRFVDYISNADKNSENTNVLTIEIVEKKIIHFMNNNMRSNTREILSLIVNEDIKSNDNERNNDDNIFQKFKNVLHTKGKLEKGEEMSGEFKKEFLTLVQTLGHNKKVTTTSKTINSDYKTPNTSGERGGELPHTTVASPSTAAGGGVSAGYSV